MQYLINPQSLNPVCRGHQERRASRAPQLDSPLIYCITGLNTTPGKTHKHTQSLRGFSHFSCWIF